MNSRENDPEISKSDSNPTEKNHLFNPEFIPVNKKDPSKNPKSFVRPSGEKKPLTAPPKQYPLKRNSTKSPSFKKPQKLQRQYTIASTKKKKGFLEYENSSSENSDKDETNPLFKKKKTEFGIYEALTERKSKNQMKIIKGNELSTCIDTKSYILTLNQNDPILTPTIKNPNDPNVKKVRSNSIIGIVYRHMVGKTEPTDSKQAFHKQMSMRYPENNSKKAPENITSKTRLSSFFGFMKNTKNPEVYPDNSSPLASKKSKKSIESPLSASKKEANHSNKENKEKEPSPLERALSIRVKESEILMTKSKRSSPLELKGSTTLDKHLQEMNYSPTLSYEDSKGKMNNNDGARKKISDLKEKVVSQDFTLEDFMTLKKEVEREKNILEEEIKNVTKNKYTNVEMKLKGKFVEKWTRAKWNIKAAARMRRLNDDIKCYGSSFNISGIQKRMAKLEHLFYRQKTITEKFQRSYIFMPDSSIRLNWSYVVIFLLFYTSYITPYRVVYVDTTEYTDPWFFVETAVDILFFIDILITMNSAYIDEKGKLIVDRCQILTTYLKTWLFLDLIGIFPFYLLDTLMAGSEDTLSVGDNYNDVLKFLRFPRLYRLIRIARLVKFIKKAKAMKIFNCLQDFFQMGAASIKITKFLFTISICVNIMACLWYFVAKMRGFGPDTWVAKLHELINEKLIDF